MRFRKPTTAVKNAGNQRRPRFSVDESFLHVVKRRSKEKTNRRLNTRGKAVWASIALEEMAEEEEERSSFFTQVFRIFLAVVLLPFCWVTLWTFMELFFHTTIEEGFWQSSQFWYFSIGSLLMLGWFWSKLGQSFFLYLYVFGHEATHAVFVKLFGGKVLDMDWGTEGGYVTTDKTNWVIALSPYFVPFWSIVAVIVHVVIGLFYQVTALANLVFYAIIGASWAFHLAWTLWMIPREQPDLKENGTFLSLVLICLGNLLVLTVLLCLASAGPTESFRNFGYEWFGNALTGADMIARWIREFAMGVLHL